MGSSFTPHQRCYRLLVVFDVRNRLDNLTDLDAPATTWTNMEMPTGEAQTLLENLSVKGFVSGPPFRIREGVVSVRIHDRLMFVLSMAKSGLFSVTYMPWEEFVVAVMKRAFELDGIVQDHDLVFGGPDFSDDLSQCFLGLGPRSSDFTDAFISMSHRIHVWPNPNELLHCGRKLMGIEQLDLAARHTKTSRPQTRSLRRIDAHPPPGNYILKREFSSCSSHVHVIRDRSSLTWNQMDGPSPSSYRWLQQDIAPLLLQWGEWRLFIVDRKVCTCIMTTRTKTGNWEWNKANFGYTLERLSELLSLNPRLTGDDIAFPVGVTLAEIDESRNELYTFALDTLEHLIRAERKANGCIPSISLYCRIDIGVHIREGGELCYFVNEVARGPLATSLWISEKTDVMNIASDLGAEFAPAFHRWMSSEL